MKLAIVSKNEDACAFCKAHVENYGHVYDEKTPEAILTYGGDGTLLHAEREFPGVPKLPLRASPTCQKCNDHEIEEALEALQKGTFEKETLIKLETEVDGEKLIALNDIIIRNENVEHAMRFSVAVDGNSVFDKLIGDGLVVATPFGSTAYFHSITKDTFDKGIGLALNNVTKDIDPLIIDEDCTITVTIERGPAVVAADNKRFQKSLATGETITITQSTSALLLRPK
ncbi:hypothetical protein GOV07_00810 [Candidatus Woesearchaeota archaeon]|nr:hypothetical protein [Candidatus Woesearchaeota archaeon]